MANGYVVLNDGMVVIVKWDGEVSYEEILAHDARRRNDTSIRPGAVMLVEARSADFDTTPEQAMELSKLLAKSNQKKRISKYAMLVPDVELSKAKIYEKENLSARLDTIIFSSLTVACKWLGVDYDEILKCLSEMELK